ncbi:hypothetical protein QE152_g29585 [Popillia japonica]|uniref:Uncharacterized protein n=1 Tax=Popillia japonica TaxID=7064 RepID=A0AAW1JHG5_POPJA
MTSKNALGINQTQYGHILKKLFRHDLYVGCFDTMQKIREGDPTLEDFTTDVETLSIGLAYPITEAHLIKSLLESNEGMYNLFNMVF